MGCKLTHEPIVFDGDNGSLALMAESESKLNLNLIYVYSFLCVCDGCFVKCILAHWYMHVRNLMVKG